jgi:hypothetical protein
MQSSFTSFQAVISLLESGLKLDFVGASPSQNQAFRRVLKHALVISHNKKPTVPVRSLSVSRVFPVDDSARVESL